MAQINGFDFNKYDVGGTGATAGDGKLTGAEVAKAKADGWTIWDGCSKNDKIEKFEEKNSLKGDAIFGSSGWKKISKAMFEIGQIVNSSSYKEYKTLAKQKLAENLQNGMELSKVTEKAKKDTLQQLGLSENAFNGRWNNVQLLDYGINEGNCSISKESVTTFIDFIKSRQNK